VLADVEDLEAVATAAVVTGHHVDEAFLLFPVAAVGVGVGVGASSDGDGSWRWV
jgi:hypothetical protein